MVNGAPDGCNSPPCLAFSDQLRRIEISEQAEFGQFPPHLLWHSLGPRRLWQVRWRIGGLKIAPTLKSPLWRRPDRNDLRLEHDAAAFDALAIPAFQPHLEFGVRDAMQAEVAGVEERVKLVVAGLLAAHPRFRAGQMRVAPGVVKVARVARRPKRLGSAPLHVVGPSGLGVAIGRAIGVALLNAFAVATDLALADGEIAEEEKKLLTKIQQSLGIPEGEAVKIIEVMLIKNKG